MVTGGRQYLGELPPPATDTGRPTDSETIRDKTVAAVEQLFAPDSAFLRLLDVASSEYLLVVEMPTRKAQSFLRYDAPVIPSRSHDLRARNTLARWASFRHEFTVRYATLIPRAVNSYHVTVEVPPEIQVRRFFLTSDVDSPALRSLAADMYAVADRYDELRRVAPKLLELELQGIASRLAEFGRRRQHDLESFKAYIEERYALFSSRPPHFPVRPAPSSPTAGAGLTLDQPIVTRLDRFAARYEADHFRKLADGLVTGATLDRLATELVEAEMDQDIHVDNDPRENAGHAQWQRRPFGADRRSVEPVTSTVYIARSCSGWSPCCCCSCSSGWTPRARRSSDGGGCRSTGRARPGWSPSSGADPSGAGNGSAPSSPPSGATTMTSPALRHPALAAVAARVASSGSPAVRFDVAQIDPDAAAPTTDVVPPTAPDRVATETLAFHVAGVGFQVHTWTPDTPSKQLDGVAASRIAVRQHESNGHGPSRGMFAGSVVINPDFLYDAEHSVEILLTLSYEPWRPTYADSLMITLAYQGITAAAAADSSDSGGA
ncbi:MAG: hypothetical protein LC635_04485, partial [Pseudonocardiaceae bacterium]|nr:hypothetical protein [Pseudonocardiaceae bacterium]